MTRAIVALTNQSTRIPEAPCREWMGGRNADGYGQRTIAANTPCGRTTERIHRFIWTAVNGPIPDGMVVMHRCDNPPCFRLDHLKLGTVAENNADRAAKNRNRNQLGTRNSTAKLTERDAQTILDNCDGELLRETAARFNVSLATVSLIRRGLHWPHLTRSTS